MALKDSWVDEYRDREALVKAKLHNTATVDQDMLVAVTIQVSAYGDVIVAGVPDRTRINPVGEYLTVSRA